MTIVSGKISQLVTLLTFFVLICCKSQHGQNYSGQVTNTIKFLDPRDKKYHPVIKGWEGPKVLFQDSLLIEELKTLEILQVNDGPEKWWMKLKKYVFIDMTTRWCYEYLTFSDTAKLILKYKLSDTSSVFSGSMYTKNRDILRTEDPVPLTDTTIDNIKYRRLIFKNEIPNQMYPESMAYFRYDQKRSVLNFFSAYKDKCDCNLVRFDEVATSDSSAPMSFETRIDRNYLTPEEQNVFKAWKKNAEGERQKK